MDGLDGYNEGTDNIDSEESFEESHTESLDVDVSSSIDSIEPTEGNIEFPVEDTALGEPEYVESVMDSVEVDDVFFDDERIIETSDEAMDVSTSETLDISQDTGDGIAVSNLEMLGGFNTDTGNEYEIVEGDSDEYEQASNLEDNDVKILSRDPSELWESGNRAIEDTLEVMRDDLRDNGIEDGDRMENLIAHERMLLQEQLAHDIEGDFSYRYDIPAWQKDPSIIEKPSADEVSEAVQEGESLVEWNEDGYITIGQLEENKHISELKEINDIQNEDTSTIVSDIESSSENLELEAEDNLEVIEGDEVPVEQSEGESIFIDHSYENMEISEEIDTENESENHSLDVMNDVEADAIEFDDAGVEEAQSLEQAENVELVNENIAIENNELSQDALDSTDEMVDAHVTIDNMSDAVNSHDYGLEDYENDSQDLEWQELYPQPQEVNKPETDDTMDIESQNIDHVDAHASLDNMSEYMNSHNYCLEDYEIYSQDPEWQALNGDLQMANGSEIPDALDGVEDQSPERVYDDFEQSVLENNPEFYETGSFYSQGVNSRGFEGTCGQTSQANTINKLLDTNELTENKILDIAVENNLCNLEGPVENCGGTTTEQFMELYDKVNEKIGDKINTELFEYGNALDANQVADRLEAGDVVNVAVDSSTLWGQPHGLADLLGVRREVISDHWITVTGVNRNESGNIQGFDIIDSGGGESYVSLDRYNDMCFGTGSRIVKDPTCIVVSKKN